MQKIKGISVAIIILSCFMNVNAKTSAMISVKPELSSRAVLLAGNKIVAGDLTQNEFFILGKQDAQAISSKPVAVQEPIVKIQKPLRILSSTIKASHKVIKPIVIAKTKLIPEPKQKKWVSQISKSLKKPQIASKRISQKTVARKSVKQRQVISKVAIKSVKRVVK